MNRNFAWIGRIFTTDNSARKAKKSRSWKPGVRSLEDRTMLTVLFYNPPASPEPIAQTASIILFASGNKPTTYQISASPADAVELGQTSVTVPAGKSLPVSIKPKRISSSVNDVQVRVSANGQQPYNYPFTFVSATFPSHIRNDDTPSEMPDRIPPRVNTMVDVAIQPDLKGSREFVTLTVAGQDANNGTVTINGKQTLNITSSGRFALSSPNGSTQTTPGYGGRLFLAAGANGQNVVYSNGFSVSAIPINFESRFATTNLSQTVAGPDQRGFAVNVFWASDSGAAFNSDLSQVNLMEQFETMPMATGTLSSVNFQGQQKPFAATGPGSDIHSINKAYIRSPGGRLVQSQVYTFQDKRTGSKFYAAPGGGFSITHTITYNSNSRRWEITTTKQGQLVTANKFTSKAGKTTDANANSVPIISVSQGA